MIKQCHRIDHNVPISKTVRAGDFVFTSAFGPWLFDPRNVTFDADGNILDDGTGLSPMPFDEQVHKTFGFIKHALEVADCTLDDVIQSECWLTDARDFVRFNTIYATYFTKDPPVRCIFPMKFMFNCKVEMKVTAYKPLKA
jgi:2-iminobutanoate/2-iminopropanoate deaminase